MGESRLGLLIASPPCQAWSMAGKREGLKDQARVLDLCSTWAADPSAPRPGGWHDERSPLAAEPMRWASALRPALMAWEQVPPVLDLWSHCARLLGVMGYSTWVGVISAERYGVPQTRKRAILMASLLGAVAPPTPTHQAYVPGEPARHEIALDGEILPWVSMAEALSWPSGERGLDRRQGNMKMRANAQDNAAVRDAHEPAPTIKGGNDSGDRVWMQMGDRVQPGGGATTVNGDPRISEPGWRGSPDDYDAEGNYIGKRSMDNAVRVSVEEASILQSFPPDYPWRGSPTAQFRQIGNAVPPLLARAILESLTEGSDIGSDCIDLFAGPGGWDCGARDLGIDPLGIELDPTACATREAAGLRTLCGDVAQLDPASFADVAMEAA